jgi:hypothetical protein
MRSSLSWGYNTVSVRARNVHIPGRLVCGWARVQLEGSFFLSQMGKHAMWTICWVSLSGALGACPGMSWVCTSLSRRSAVISRRKNLVLNSHHSRRKLRRKKKTNQEIFFDSNFIFIYFHASLKQIEWLHELNKLTVRIRFRNELDFRLKIQRCEQIIWSKNFIYGCERLTFLCLCQFFFCFARSASAVVVAVVVALRNARRPCDLWLLFDGLMMSAVWLGQLHSCCRWGWREGGPFLMSF